uniref:Uncharacterized protein n=1 Tax=Arundo donax TaxID=35708 RepID=A0A0A8YBU1_ARUDO
MQHKCHVKVAVAVVKLSHRVSSLQQEN